MTDRKYHALSGFEQVVLQKEHEDLLSLAKELVVAVEIASEFLPTHWKIDSVPLNKVELALAAVRVFDKTHSSKIGSQHCDT